MYKISSSGNHEWTSHDGETVYNKSPYYISNIKDEKRYLVLRYIVAIKRDEKFINIITQKEFEIINGHESKEQVGIYLDFGWPKKDNDL